jgi:hypothetical protein
MLAAVANDTDLEYLMLDETAALFEFISMGQQKTATGRYPNIRKLTRQFF